ncbi:serine hydrolase, partial [Klebsiella pneumoniae]|uniref:serine hydrolase n=1 Tax=Klebsiella pneumoniae TaxID=573 RepID=UPI0034DF73E3
MDAAKYRAMLMAAVKQARVGEAPRYSSMGVSLLGDALAHAAGMDFADLLDQRLLRPLGIRRTDFLRPEEEPDLVAISVN